MTSLNSSDEDVIRPSAAQSRQVYSYSRSTWNSLLSCAQSTQRLPSSCCDIRSLLHKTPSIPDSSVTSETTVGKNLLLEGYSKWSVSSSSTSCELESTKESSLRTACIGVSQPSTCGLSDDHMPEWTGFQSLPHSSGNYLSVFVLGWSYVFSARLVELRQMSANDKVAYTDAMAQWSVDGRHSSNGSFDLDLGNTEPGEIRWWAAILAEGRGWKATLARDEREYYSPWECHLVKSPFRLHSSLHIQTSSVSTLEPPSSTTALSYLLNFAQSHGSVDQLIAALPAAMMLPSHVRFGAPITLPRPAKTCSTPSQKLERAFSERLPVMEEIPHLIAFSSLSGSVSSSLFGSFWEPGIPCNLVSEWLNPPLKELIPSLIRSKSYHTLICVMSYRRPSLASLWLGSAISGLIPRVFRVCQSFFAPVSLETVTWTASPQSFMDPEYHRKASIVNTNARQDSGLITREDEFRLLYLTDTRSDTHGSLPLSPYPPFGFVSLREIAIGVRLHYQCDHKMSYQSWEWMKRNGQTLSDFGITRQHATPSAPTINIFLKTIATLGALMLLPLFMRPANNWGRLPNKLLGGPGALLGSVMLVAAGLLPRSVTEPPYLGPKVRLWFKALWVRHSSIRSLFGPYEKETRSDESLSEMATRNLFSWTLFSDGTKPEERMLWRHEWLESFLADSEMDEVSSDSSFQDDAQIDGRNDNVQAWLYNNRIA